MQSAIYGKRKQQAIEKIVKAASELASGLGLDPELVTAVQTVRGNNDRLRELARLQALAALMGEVANADPGGEGLSLAQVLAVPELSKKSAALIEKAFAPEEPEEG